MTGSPNIAATQQVKPADGEALIWACDQRDPRTLGPGLFNDARNLRYTDGLPTTRKGVVKPAWANRTQVGSNLIGSLGTPFGSGVFRDPNGVEWQLVAAGGFVWRTRPQNANVTVPLPPGVVIAGPVRFVQAFDRVFLFRGRYLAPLVMTSLTDGFQDLLPQFDSTQAYNAAVIALGQTADEVAYGPYIAVASITWSNGVATVTTTAQHGYVTGSDVTIAGANERQFNGRWSVTVLDDLTFTFALKNSSSATASGTILCTNNAYYWKAAGSVAKLTALVRQVSASFTLTSLTSAATFTLTSLTSGRYFTINSITHIGSTASAKVIAVDHQLVTGMSVTISNSNVAAYNGTFSVTVIDTSTFNIALFTSTPGANQTTPCTGYEAYSNQATATKAGHGLSTGDTVTISGATPSLYNGTFQIVVTSTSQFTYALPSNPGTASVTGTISCQPSTYTTALATKAGHGLSTGDSVTIAGATPSAYNGTYTITVVSSSQFTYTFAGGTSPATGTITCTSSSATTAKGTAPNHGLADGDYVTIAGATPVVYNGTFQVNVLDTDNFVYTLPSNPGADAAGTITAQCGRVYAGQTPDSNPEAWQRSYNILPNADTALFVNNLLLVPTAYEPSSVDNYATFSGGAYKKVDYIVATNYLDYVHFTFANEFRINAGGSDEIVDLFKFGDGTVIVLKDKSWAVLGNVQGDLTQVTLDIRSTEYGCAGPRAWTVVGSNAYFLVPKYGVMVIRQTDLGKMLSVNVPLSAPIQRTINQLDWTKAASFRLSHWDNKLYIACVHQTLGNILLVYDFVASVRMGNNVWESGVMTQGWTPMDTGSALSVVEFHRLNLLGEDRHFFLDAAGYVNLLEESDCGDQIVDASGLQGLGWEEIGSYALTRSYNSSLMGQTRAFEESWALATWNPCYSVNVIFAGVADKIAVVTNVTRSRTLYDRPFDKAPWDQSNINDDFLTAGRQDYSVALQWNLLPPAATGEMHIKVALNGSYVLTVQDPSNPGSTGLSEVVWCSPTSDNVTWGSRQELNYTIGQPLAFTVGDMGAPAGFIPKVFLSLALPATASLLATGIALNSGVTLLQFQEALDTRRIGWRQGKSYQLEFSNTQGRIRLIGNRVAGVNTRNFKGIT